MTEIQRSHKDIESEDFVRVELWFLDNMLSVERIPSSGRGKTPDLSIRDGFGQIAGLCEMKSFGLGPWEWDEKNRGDDGIYSFSGSKTRTHCDSVKVRLSNSITSAWRQLREFDPEHNQPWIVALVSHDWFADLQDIEVILTGRESIGPTLLYREGDNPNRQIRAALDDIDLLLWLDNEGSAKARWNDGAHSRYDYWPDWLLKLSGA